MRRARIGLACLALLGALPSSAAATDRETLLTILRDCDDGRLAGTYRLTDIRAALRAIPADMDQYKDCQKALSRQLMTARRADTAPHTTTSDKEPVRPDELVSGGEPEPTRPATPEEQLALERLADAPPPHVVTGAGLAPARHVAARNDLPVGSIVVLGLLAALAGVAAVRRVSARG